MYDVRLKFRAFGASAGVFVSHRIPGRLDQACWRERPHGRLTPLGGFSFFSLIGWPKSRRGFRTHNRLRMQRAKSVEFAFRSDSLSYDDWHGLIGVLGGLGIDRYVDP